MVKVKHFTYSTDWTKLPNLETQINDFVTNNDVDIIDVKHSMAFNLNGNTGDHYTAGKGTYQYSVILMYKERDNKGNVIPDTAYNRTR